MSSDPRLLSGFSTEDAHYLNISGLPHKRVYGMTREEHDAVTLNRDLVIRYSQWREESGLTGTWTL